MKLSILLLFTLHVTLYTSSKSTPYPLYAIEFGVEFPIDKQRAKILTDHFDAYFGSIEVSKDIAQHTKTLDPDFEYVRYVGRWTVGSEARETIENGQRDQVLHYLLGELAEPIAPDTTTFKVANLYGTLPDNSTLNETDVWLRVEDEWMRITSATGKQVTVERAWDNSTASAHSKGASILAPVVGSKTKIRNGKLALRHDTASRLRWQEVLEEALKHNRENDAATWIDILMGNFASYTLGGETVPMNSGRQWNFQTWSPYSEDDLAEETEKAITWIQNRYRDVTGEWPTIWANNMEFPQSPDSPRLQMLLPSEHLPRPLDGFAMENMYAHWGYGGGSGKNFMWVPEDEWIEHLQSLMLMGELKVNARPLMFDGGIDNLKFARLPHNERERLINYGYASYLMGVKVEPDGSIYTKLGSCPIAMIDDKPQLHIYDCFTWDIGHPIETRLSSDALGYRIPNSSVFIRRFENGIVLVNPSAEQSNPIQLPDTEKTLIDPTIKTPASTTLSLGPRTGKILLLR
ncbi:hypothetical protein [Pelagicoccus mobilis]|uniref:Uncharacterized protein n=1 Tax=Pelagicoccus mobilis TaxID=415221 RepID=A0A934VT39_9BACT|nr:hypothetical protein [Pelagicoccus mobilis]MBK1879308.1 hypothetical protein [Pelagicoccus mobilis]